MKGQLDRWYSGWPQRYPAWARCCPCTCRCPEGVARQLHTALFIYLLAPLLETAQLPRLLLSPSFSRKYHPYPAYKGLSVFQRPQGNCTFTWPDSASLKQSPRVRVWLREMPTRGTDTLDDLGLEACGGSCTFQEQNQAKLLLHVFGR